MTIDAISIKLPLPELTLRLCESLRQTGFARIVDHGLSTATLKTAYELMQTLFALPLEEKQRYSLKRLGERGYTGFGLERAKGQTEGDLKEFWHIGKNLKNNSPYKNRYPDNVWPLSVPYFEQEFVKLYAQLESISLVLLKSISQGLNIDPLYFPELIHDGNSVLRLIHYPPVNGMNTVNQMRAAPHADINLMTLLVGATDSGLQLLDKNNQWQDVETGPNEIVIDTGDMMALVTGNTLPSTIHRVINPEQSNKARYSMPFFLHPHSDALLECLPQFNDTLTAKPITAGDFLQQRLRENGLLNN